MAKKIKKNSRLIGIIFLIMIISGAVAITSIGKAAIIANRSMTLSNANTSQGSTTYDFAGNHSGTSVLCIQTKFSTSATDPDAGVPTGMTTTGASKSGTGWNGWTPGSWTLNATSNGILKLTSTGEAGGSAYSFALAGITNSSSAATYYAHVSTYTNADCATGGTDSGVASFAIFQGVTVSVSVAETLTSSINGVTTANCPNFSGGVAPNEVLTTSTAVQFGNANTETFYDACQDVRVGTNAGSGYTVTVQEATPLTYLANTIADEDCDGSCTDSAEAGWATNTNNGFGYCMSDQGSYGDAAETADAGWGTNACNDGTTYFKTIADISNSDTPQTIMRSAGPISDDRAYIGFRLSVDSAQAAGTYQNTLSYITTPTY